MEIWKDIEGYEKKYQVSNLGRVRRIKTTDSWNRNIGEYILTPVIKDNGYMFVGLTKNKKHRSKYIHRLVANAFIENPKEYNEVNHKNGDKTNNTVENLEWVTHKENCNHRQKVLHRSEKKVICLDNGIEYSSIIEASRKTNIDNSGIAKCCKGIYKTCGGYQWRYVDDVL